MKYDIIHTCRLCKARSEPFTFDETYAVGSPPVPEGWAVVATTTSVRVLPPHLDETADIVGDVGDLGGPMPALLRANLENMTVPFHVIYAICPNCQTGPLFDAVREDQHEREDRQAATPTASPFHPRVVELVEPAAPTTPDESFDDF